MTSSSRVYDTCIELEDGTVVADRVPARSARQACHTMAEDHLPWGAATITATNPTDARDTARITLTDPSRPPAAGRKAHFPGPGTLRTQCT